MNCNCDDIHAAVSASANSAKDSLDARDANASESKTLASARAFDKLIKSENDSSMHVRRVCVYVCAFGKMVWCSV